MGFHGTDLVSGKRILSEGFDIADDDEGWLGRGVYFFLDGIRGGADMAADWARFRKGTSPLCVIKCKISAPKQAVLDLREVEQLKSFDEVRHDYANTQYDVLLRRRDLKVKKRKDIRLDDALVTREVLSRLDKSILVHNLYVKTQVLRDLALESSYPTATACCVADVSHIKSKCILPL